MREHHVSTHAWRRHHTAFKPVGIDVPKLIRETCRRRGFINVDIVLRWPEIVGRALAEHTWPMRIQWPRHQETILRADGTEAPGTQRTRLVVGVAPAKALDVEYAKHDIMNRVNGYLGYRAVTELVASPEYRVPDEGDEPTPAFCSQDPRPADSSGDPLKAALARLGEAIGRRLG